MTDCTFSLMTIRRVEGKTSPKMSLGRNDINKDTDGKALGRIRELHMALSTGYRNFAWWRRRLYVVR